MANDATDAQPAERADATAAVGPTADNPSPASPPRTRSRSSSRSPPRSSSSSPPRTRSRSSSRSRSRSRGRAVISASAFPHLIDAIFAAAPRTALLALGTACRAWRDRAAAQLAAHIVISSHTPLDVLGRGGRIPGLSLDSPSYALVLAHTRTVDVVGALGMPRAKLLQLSAALTHVETVRLRHQPAGRVTTACPIPTKRLVTFTTFTECGLWDHPAVAEVGPVPDGVQRFVLNVRYDPGRAWMPQAFIPPFARPIGLQEVVVLFTPKVVHREDELNWFRRANKPMGMFNSLVLGMATTIPRVRYVFVDVQRLRPVWLGIESGPGAAARDVVEEVRGAVAEGLRRWSQWSADEARAGARGVQFLTREEYAAQVGEEQFALETSE